MRTRNVVLTDHLAGVVDDLVESGRYQNASEVMREGLRLIELRERYHEVRRTKKGDAVRAGLEAAEEGRFTDFASFDEMEEYLRELGEPLLLTETLRRKP